MSAALVTDLRDMLACFHMLRRYLLRGRRFRWGACGKKKLNPVRIESDASKSIHEQRHCVGTLDRDALSERGGDEIARNVSASLT